MNSQLSEKSLTSMESTVYDYINHIAHQMQTLSPEQMIEFEMRFGHIRNHQGKQTFDSVISEKCFNHIKSVFDNSTFKFKNCTFVNISEYYVGQNRYTLDENGNILQCMNKANLNNSNHSLDADNTFDVRMSLNIENNIQIQKMKPKDVIKKAQHVRHKKRWSYELDMIRYDLSMIQNPDIPNPQYEIELEFTDVHENLSIYQFKHIAKNISYKICDVLHILSQKA